MKLSLPRLLSQTMEFFDHLTNIKMAKLEVLMMFGRPASEKGMF